MQRLLDELDTQEAMAWAAMPAAKRVFGWASLTSESGLTQTQEDFVDYWSPQRVIDQCRATRNAIGVVWNWYSVLAAAEPRYLDELLGAWESGIRDAVRPRPASPTVPSPKIWRPEDEGSSVAAI